MPAIGAAVYTFLFSDLEESTRLWHAYPDAMADVIARLAEITKRAVESCKGQIVKTTGDGALAVFPNAKGAIAAAVIVQEKVLVNNWPINETPSIRIAIHSGEAEERDGDFFGLTVHKCERLLRLAHGGQILITESVHEKLPGDLGETSLLSLGEQRLRDIARVMHVYQVVHPGLPADFPKLFTAETPPHNLPLQLTSFIGREKEIAELRELLAEHRLVTLTGIGGSGKTRLAQKLALEMLDDFPFGAWFIEFAYIQDPALLPSALASVLRAKEEPDLDLIKSLTRYLSAKKALLIFDNCEHVLEAAGAFAETLLRQSPDAKIVVTSREPLGVAGERVYRISGFSFGQSEGAASKLFEERASAASHGFNLNEKNREAVEEICKRLDGLPLAIEIAAAAVSALPPKQILSHLSEGLHSMENVAKTSPRHHSLEAALSWSYELLSVEEKALFARLSVFSGGWNLKAAEEVCADESLPRKHIMRILSNLFRKSLVAIEEGVEDESRFRFLETVLTYSKERLEERGEMETFTTRHCEYYCDLALEGAAHLSGESQAIWLTRLETELENLRKAFHWCVEAERRLTLAASLWRFWYIHGRFREGRAWLESALSRSENCPKLLIARANNGAGILALAQGAFQDAERFLEEGLRIRRDEGNKAAVAGSLSNLGMLAREQGNLAFCKKRYLETLAIWKELGEVQLVGSALANLGAIAIDSGDYHEALEYLREARPIIEKIGDVWVLAQISWNAAQALLETGQPADSAIEFVRAFRTYLHLGDMTRLATAALTVCPLLIERNAAPIAASIVALVEREVASENIRISKNDMRRLGTCRNRILEMGIKIAPAEETLKKAIEGTISVLERN